MRCIANPALSVADNAFFGSISMDMPENGDHKISCGDREHFPPAQAGQAAAQADLEGNYQNTDQHTGGGKPCRIQETPVKLVLMLR